MMRLMKPVVAIALIVCGVFVVALPPLSDAWHASMSVRLLQNLPPNTNVNVSGNMEDAYRFGCWLLGAAMILIAIAASVLPSMRASTQIKSPRL